MIRASSIIQSNYKRVSGTCAFIAFTRAPDIGLKDRMHSTVNVLKLRTLKKIFFPAVRNFRNYVYEKMLVFEILECGLIFFFS